MMQAVRKACLGAFRAVNPAFSFHNAYPTTLKASSAYFTTRKSETLFTFSSVIQLILAIYSLAPILMVH